MPFDDFELRLLQDSLKQMREKSVQNRLSAFKKLRNTALNNERWFEWELYYRLLKVERSWIREKRNRRKNKRLGDGVDLQFSNGKFIELRAATTDKTNMNWITDGIKHHREANAVLFLALFHKNLKKWLEKRKSAEKTIKDSGKEYELWMRIKDRGEEYELQIKKVNDDWIVGIVKPAIHN